MWIVDLVSVLSPTPTPTPNPLRFHLLFCLYSNLFVGESLSRSKNINISVLMGCVFWSLQNRLLYYCFQVNDPFVFLVLELILFYLQE